MNTTIGTVQQALTLASNITTAPQMYYFMRFVSETFASSQTSVSANTWTYNFAAEQSSGTAKFPVNGSNQPVDLCVYVWRPGTGKVGNILDGTTAATVNESSAGSLVSVNVSFTGAAVASTQGGDVIVCEIWFNTTQLTSTSRLLTFAFDGTTVNTVSGSIVSNHASFIETPQTLTFGAGGGGGGPATDMTQITAKSYANKFIAKV